MNLRLFFVLLIIGVTTSVGWGASSGGSASLAPVDDGANNAQIVFGSANNNVPGGNAFEAVSPPREGNVAAVPEPSTIALISLGALGFAALRRYRQSSAQ
jgi:hypothetical protein